MKVLKYLFLLFALQPAFGYETDQYTTPERPLAEVGTDFTEFIKKEISSVIKIVNHRDDLLVQLKQLEARITYPSPHDTEVQIAERNRLSKEKEKIEQTYQMTRSKDGIRKLIYEKIGGELFWQDQRDGVFGIGLSIFPYEDNDKEGEPVLFLPGRLNTIYSFSGFHRILSSSYFVFCSTMRAYGVYFGVDKLGHMFNQGYQYYELYAEARSNGKDHEAALKKAVDFGVDLEFKIFGKLVDGIYSNADLAANMAGFYFYRNLFDEVTMNGKVYAPLLEWKEDLLSVNPQTKKREHEFMQKFFTDHLNEALNPSHTESMQIKPITKAVKKRCSALLNFYGIHSRDEATRLLDSMSSLFGHAYGHNPEANIRIDAVCF